MEFQVEDFIKVIVNKYDKYCNFGTDIILKVAKYSAEKHRNQKRKYIKIPYFFHTLEVASILTNMNQSPILVAAAFLHDVVEDCDTSIEEIENKFGSVIAKHVLDVTDVSKPEDGNRAQRKAIDREHLKNISPESKTLKLADLISNTLNIEVCDPKFAEVYLEEKKLLLPHLKEGDRYLYELANDLTKIYGYEYLLAHYKSSSLMIVH